MQELAAPEGWVLSDARYRITITDEFADEQHLPQAGAHLEKQHDSQGTENGGQPSEAVFDHAAAG